VPRPPLLRKLAAALDAPGGPGRGEHLLVAVSGGPDSTALLAALVERAPARGLRLTAGHVDHGLRGAESAADRAGVDALGARLGVPVVTRAVRLAPGPGLEARARQARYRALGAIVDEVGASRIVTAHTEDDQVETLLLRLLRGAGRRGLGGMRPHRGRLLRPLLRATRTDVRWFLADRGLPSAIDRTNADLRHARNRVRRLLIPFLAAEFNPRLRPALAGLADRLRDEDDLLATLAAARAQTYLDGEALRIDVMHEPVALARRIVRCWLERKGQGAASALQVERVCRLAAGTEGGAVAIPGPARVVREGGRLVRRPGRQAVPVSFCLPIGPGQAVMHPEGSWRLQLTEARRRAPGEERPPGPARAFFDADALPGDLVVRPPARGDRIRLLAGGSRKLQDVLVDAKVPREQRSTVPVLAAGENILWVAGLARGRAAPLRDGTQRIVEAVLERFAKS
jgi:tRNA(Ile)-lysidine synthase